MMCSIRIGAARYVQPAVRECQPRQCLTEVIATMKLSTRLTLAMVALVSLTTTTVALFNYRDLEATILPHALERLEAHASLRAIELETGRIAWEVPQIGPANTWGGLLSTASGLVFFCEDSGAFAAADAKTGKLLWHFHTSQSWKASPMTYSIDGRQYVSVAVGSTVLAFGLPAEAADE